MKEPPDSPPVTLRDIARKLGIHHSTVGRALQNARNISPARRKEIQKAAEKMGYRPNAVATALGHQRHSSKKSGIGDEIAWINFWDPPEKLRSLKEFNLYWKGARERAELNGYRLEEFACSQQMSPARLEKILLARNIQGILVPPHGGNKSPLFEGRAFDWSKFSVVRFGYSIPGIPCNLVTSNHLISGIVAMENMKRLGYKRPGFITNSPRHINFKAGFLITQPVLGSEQQTSIFTFSQTDDHFKELPILSSWLKTYRPDAILTDAAETRDLLVKLGYQVPGDIGLAASSVLDGNADAGIDQNSEEIGKAAVEILISQINHNEFGFPKVVRETLITGKWVDGASLPPRVR